MNSEQEDPISLHGGDDFSVGDAEPPKKKQKSGAFRGPENNDFESGTSRGPADDDIASASLIEGVHK